MKPDLVAIAEIAVSMPVYPNALFPPSLYYRFLLALASVVRPSLSVELGVCKGGASLHLALGYSQNKVIGVDHALSYPDHVQYVKSVCPNFEFWLMDSIESAVEVNKLDLKVNILFLDTKHVYDQVMGEYKAYESLLAEDAVVLFDDLDCAGVRKAFVEIAPKREHVDLGTLRLSRSGFGVILM